MMFMGPGITPGRDTTRAATVDFVGNSSMDITVEVYAERVSTGERRHTHTAHVVFVERDRGDHLEIALALSIRSSLLLLDPP